LQNIENQAMINVVAIDNRTPQNVNQSKDHSIETKDQQSNKMDPTPFLVGGP
jgi:hypothetical protein